MAEYLKMDCASYDFERNSESLIGKVDNDMSVPPQTDNVVCDGFLTGKQHENESVDTISLEESGSRIFGIPSSEELSGSSSPDFIKNNNVVQQLLLPPMQTEKRVEATGASGPQEGQRGRARLIRLQAAPINSVESSVELQGSESLDDAGHQDSSSSLPAPEEIRNLEPIIPFPPTADEEATSPPDLIRDPSNPDEIPNPKVMQRFLTSDGQYVYGYKDTDGQYQFFYPTLNERESHNEKERKRRSRVSDACSSLRKLVPGLTEKTDKASVFEHSARYLKFLRNKYGNQFDEAFCEKYFLERS